VAAGYSAIGPLKPTGVLATDRERRSARGGGALEAARQFKPGPPAEMKMETDDTITALRDELQRLRVERIGLMTDIQKLKAEVARLRAENDSLRGLHARRL